MDALQQEIIQAALPNIVFDGWNMQTLRTAAQAIGKPELEADRAFPGGIIEALNCWTADANQQLATSLQHDYNFDSMKIRERIATGVMVKLRASQAHKEAVRRALTIYNMPSHMSDGLKVLYATCDIIWRAAGDTSTDWNFYSKRLILSKVYMATLYIWLDDESENQQETEAFLHRRIEEVMQFQKAKFKVKGWIDGLSKPNFFRSSV